MKLLAHVHTLNDEEVIDRCLQSLWQQSYPLREIVIVDNGSTDSTLRRSFPKEVTIIPHSDNLGTSGAVATGFRHAMDKGYDWVWVLDADSLPRRDALEKLVDLYESFDVETKRGVGILSASHLLWPSKKLFQGRRLTPGGPRLPRIDARKPYCEVDSVIWSGGLFNLEAVRAAGFPWYGNAGYWQGLSLDYGDMEFSYRIKHLRYKVLVHSSSFIDHHVGDDIYFRVFGYVISSTNHPPFRRYLFFRNMVYFWLYLHHERRIFPTSFYIFGRLLITITKILMMERKPLAKAWACVRGTWDGLQKELDRNFR
jgi:rhamnosyltransferase